MVAPAALLTHVSLDDLLAEQLKVREGGCVGVSMRAGACGREWLCVAGLVVVRGGVGVWFVCVWVSVCEVRRGRRCRSLFSERAGVINWHNESRRFLLKVNSAGAASSV